jgi:hypothetical protein
VHYKYRFIFIKHTELSRLENGFIAVELAAISWATESENGNIDRAFYYLGHHPET